jgi:hypothetical protein
MTGCATNQEPVIVVHHDKKSNIMQNGNNKQRDFSVLTQEQTLGAPTLFTNGLEKEKLALVYGIKNIGKFSIEAIDVISSYLALQHQNYTLRVFDINRESGENYDKVLDELNELKINNAIFLVTDTHIKSLLENEKNKDINIFLPIVNKSLLEDNNITNNSINVDENIVFGGIDYDAQFDAIVERIKYQKAIDLNNTESVDLKLFEIHDNKSLSQKLYKSFVGKMDNFRTINMYGKNPNYHEILSRYKDLNQSIVVLNTSIVKSSIILSQMRANEIYPKVVYSTQLNYTPLIFQLTQAKDRTMVKITNSIGKMSHDVEAIFDLVGIDIRHKWVNYSTLVGVEYLLTKANQILGNEINNNQVQYMIDFVDVDKNSFK